jgi:hypothetical protein
MDSTILAEFRHTLYTTCFTRARDALFDLADALLTDTQARSFVELSQAQRFQRAWPSLYEALEDGRIDRSALQRLFTSFLPAAMVGTRLVLGVDVSSILRPDAHTSEDRTLVHRSNLPKDATPVGPGWQFSTLVVLPDPVSSATYILDNRRVPSSETATSIGVAQLRELLPLLLALGVSILIVLDRGYSHAPWVQASEGLLTDQLLRARGDRVLYRPPLPRQPHQRGRSPLDGPRFKGTDPHTHQTPDADWSGSDAKGQPVQVTAWRNLHLSEVRQVPITVLRVIRSNARGTKRDPRVSWFWWLGGPLPPLKEIPGLYARRFGQEHGYRLDKQELLWAKPRLRRPEQFERWTEVVSLVHNQLVLAHPLVEVVRRPWERASRPATPRQVRRAMGRIIGLLGTPARRPQPRGKAPGRAAGTTVRPASRHPVIRKGSKTKASIAKTARKQLIQRE